MNSRIGRRIAMLASTAALVLGGVGLSAGSASAADSLVWLTTDHGVGLYIQPNVTGGKDLRGPDLFKANYDAVLVHCWTVGQYLDNGDVWYKVTHEWYGSGGIDGTSGDDEWYVDYVYGAYVDGNAAFHSGTIPRC
ncbi:hypothetical protein [Peterkaempfera sp. SMS 1(5)a]|uniref:hypothetical protein n=1 Tax=Peterkaempfera podocarpi TaxID=3232308 RepID=UPI00366A8FF5